MSDNSLMDQTNAIKVLIKAVQVAQQKGCYTLDEASVIHRACSCFINNNPDENSLNSGEQKSTETVNDPGIITDQ